MAVGGRANASGGVAIALGQRAQATGGSSMAFGVNALASAESAYAFGRQSAATAAYSFAAGNVAYSQGAASIALGASSNSVGYRSIAIGSSDTNAGGNSYDANTQTRATGDLAVALGAGARAANGNDVALGAGSTTAAPNTGTTAFYGKTAAGVAQAPSGVVSVGKAGGERQIQHVAAGVVSATSTDAINGSQLQSVVAGVDALGASTAATLGGNASYSATTGQVTGFSQSIAPVSTAGAVGTGQAQTTVSGALTALNTNTTNLANAAVKYDNPSTRNIITLGATGGSGATAGGVTITNLKAGAISATSTEGINGAQMNTEIVRGTQTGNDTASAFGGGSTFNAATGTLTAPTYNVAGGTQRNVGDALVALNTLAGTGWNLSANGAAAQNIAPGGTVDFAAGTNLTVARDGSKITYTMVNNPTFTGLVTASGGINMSNAKIANLAAGTLDGDAVNFKQLKDASSVSSGKSDALGQSVATTLGGNATYSASTGQVTGFSQSINPISTAGAVGGGQAQTTVSGALTALNTNTTNLANAAVKYDNPSTRNIITLGATGGSGATAGGVTITNLKAGAISATSTEGINGAQMNTEIVRGTQTGNDTASAFGGGSTFNAATGTLTAPTYNVAGGTQRNVGDALVALNTLAGTGWNLSANGAAAQNIAPGGTVDFAAGTNLTVARDGSKITYTMVNNPTFTGLVTASGGINMSNTKIVNLADGSADGDAVNFKQLKDAGSVSSGKSDALGQSVATTLGGNATYSASTGQVTGFSQSINPISTAGAVGGGQSQTTVSGALAALNTNTTNLANVAVKYDDPSARNIITLGATGGSGATVGGVTITNLKAGAVNATSTDAINGSQLNAEIVRGTQTGNDTAVALGGNASFDAATGTLTPPTYNVAGATQRNVGDALIALNTLAGTGWNLSANGATAQNIAPGGTVDFAAGTNLTVARDGSKITYTLVDNPIFAGLVTARGGIDMSNSKIINLADGTADGDAVNFKQLKDAGNAASGKSDALGQSVAATLGGNASYSATTGEVTGFSQSINGISTAGAVGAAQSQTTVSGALTALNTNTANLANVAVKYDDPAARNIITLGATGGSGATAGGVTITNLKAGVNGLDAVNVNQLDNLGNVLTADIQSLGDSTAATLGGSATFDPQTGKISGFSQNISAVSNMGAVGAAVGYTKVSDALSALNINVDNIANIAVKYDAAGGNIITLGATGGAGAPTGGVTITNLKAGVLSATSTEAVNGSQLFATNQTVANIQNGGGIKYFHANSTQTDSSAAGVDSVAVGPKAVASGNNSLAMGVEAKANGLGGVAFGTLALAEQQRAIALGTLSTAQNVDSVAIGTGARASVDGSVALGYGSIANRAISPGSGSIPAGPQVLIPYNTSDARLLGAVSLGSNEQGEKTYRQIINLADGTEDQDAVTLRQLKAGIGQVTASATKYFHANSELDDSLAGGTDAVAIGPKTTVNGNNGLGIGVGAIVQQGGAGGIAIGQSAQVHLADGLALGNGSESQAEQGMAIGTRSKVTVFGGVALGANAIANTAAGVDGYVPSGADTASAAAVNATRSKLAAISIGDVAGGNFRQINGVAGGTADSDAVNVAQLKAVSSATTGKADRLGSSTASSLGGPTTYDATTGELTGFSQSINPISTAGAVGAGQAQTTVSGALTALNTNTTNLANMAVKYDDPSARNIITLGATGGSGATAGGVTITNLKAGAVNATSTDAINGSQLNAEIVRGTQTGNDTAVALGGNASFDAATGTLTPPTYNVAGATQRNVGDALIALNTLAGTGWNLSANGATAQNIAPGGTVDFAAGTNLTVARDGSKITYTLVDNPIFAGLVTARGGIDMVGTKIVNLADGTADGDAVNFKQLKDAGNAASGKSDALGQSVAATLGGNASYSATTGEVTGFSQSINGISTAGAVGAAQSQTTVSGALTALNTNTANLANVAVKYDDPAARNIITLGATGGSGATAGGVTITNLKAGVGDSDAVNVSQLKGIGDAISAKNDTLGKSTAATFGEGVTYNQTTGEITGFNQLIKSGTVNDPATGEQNYKTVKEALAALDDNVIGFNSRYQQTGKDLETAFGGGSFNAATGQFEAPKYSVQGTQYVGVGSAISALNSGLSNVISSNIVQQPDPDGTITVGKSTGGTAVDFTNKDGGARVLTGVADGAVAEGSKEAVNGGQLHQTNQRIGAVEAASKLAVKYDADEAGNALNQVTLVGANNGNPVVISNVAAGVKATDAVNKGQMEQAISNVTASGIQYDTDANGNLDKTNVTFNKGGAPTVLHNVGPGKAGTDAVNLNQLNASADAGRVYTDNQVGALRGEMQEGFSSLDSSIRETRREARRGIAAAMAMTTAPMPSAEGRTSWTSNVATFKGEVAFGASFAHRFEAEDPFALTGGVSWGGGDGVGLRAGLMGEF